MGAASHGEEATESDTYLREHPIKNPQLLLSLASSQASQGRWQEEIETLTRTIPLFEATKDFNSLALVHSRIAGAIAITEKPGDPEELDHLLKAQDCSRKGTDTKQEVEAGLALAAFYTEEKNWDKAEGEIKQALKLARKTHLSNLEAETLSAEGQTLRASKRAPAARDAFHHAAAIYETSGDTGKES